MEPRSVRSCEDQGDAVAVLSQAAEPPRGLSPIRWAEPHATVPGPRKPVVCQRVVFAGWDPRNAARGSGRIEVERDGERVEDVRRCVPLRGPLYIQPRS